MCSKQIFGLFIFNGLFTQILPQISLIGDKFCPRYVSLPNKRSHGVMSLLFFSDYLLLKTLNIENIHKVFGHFSRNLFHAVNPEWLENGTTRKW